MILWMSLVDVAEVQARYLDDLVENQCHRSLETYNGPAWRLISTLCGELATRNLANHSMRIQDVYVRTVPIPRFIKIKTWGRTRLIIRSPVQHVCTLVRLNFV